MVCGNLDVSVGFTIVSTIGEIVRLSKSQEKEQLNIIIDKIVYNEKGILKYEKH